MQSGGRNKGVAGWVGVLAGVCIAATACLAVFWWQVLSWLEDFEKLAGWAQAFGAVVAILAGFVVVWWQIETARRAASQAREEAVAAAVVLATKALELVAERLVVAAYPKQPGSNLTLRVFRTSEMIDVLREFGISQIPASMVVDFATTRSCLYAVNARITEFYETKGAAGETRLSRLKSAGRAFHTAYLDWKKLAELSRAEFGIEPPTFKLEGDIKTFVDQAIVDD